MIFSKSNVFFLFFFGFIVFFWFFGFLFFNLKTGKNAICIYCILQCIYKHKIVITVT